MDRHHYLWIGCVSILMSTAAAASDPSGNPISPPQAATLQLPESVVPGRYYLSERTGTAAAYAPATPTSVPAPQPVAPIQYAPTPEPTPQPATVYAQPVYTAPTLPPPQYTPPAPAPAAYETSRAATPHKDQFSVGVEGFYSAYRENIAALDETGPFGSVTAGYTHYFGTNWYSALDLRGSYGEVQYSSMSGTIDNIKQWETEDRVLLGRVSPTESGNRLKTYFGLGARYFSDESKGTISSTGAYGYDRRILQFYVPIGVTYEAQSNGFTYAPNLEVDPVFWGNVSSRLANVPGYEDVENHQSSGIGLRGEFMIGQLNDAGAGWQAGPFVRFWYFPDSDTATNSSGTWVEPENTRLQAGAALKLLF